MSVFVSSSVKGRGGAETKYFEKKLGNYSCSKCGSRFPAITNSGNRRPHRVGVTTQLRDLQTGIRRLKENQKKLSGKIVTINNEKKKLQTTLKNSKQTADMKELENKLSYLERHVLHLKKDKEELEQRISELAPQQ